MVGRMASCAPMASALFGWSTRLKRPINNRPQDSILPDGMTRRDLAKLAAGVAMVPQARLPGAATYTGALDGVEARVDLKSFDPVLFSRRLYDSAPLRL